MTAPKVTDWFPRGVKPLSTAEHIGVYSQKSGSRYGFQYWDGEAWYAWSETVEGAAAMFRRGVQASVFYQNDPWRGLTKRAR